MGVAVNPNTNRIYVANSDSSDVSVIEGASYTVVATVAAVGVSPLRRGGQPQHEPHLRGEPLRQPQHLRHRRRQQYGRRHSKGREDPRDVAVNPNTNRIYVANYGNNDVSVIEGASNTVVASIAVGNYPEGVVVNPSTNRIYVTNFDQQQCLRHRRRRQHGRHHRSGWE